MDAQLRMVCPLCARGCGLDAAEGSGGIVSVEGNACPRGAAFAVSELRDPRRTVRTSVPSARPGAPRVPVLIENVPAGRVLELMGAVDRLSAPEGVAPGHVVADDFLGIGLRVVAERR